MPLSTTEEEGGDSQHVGHQGKSQGWGVLVEKHTRTWVPEQGKVTVRETEARTTDGWVQAGMGQRASRTVILQAGVTAEAHHGGPVSLESRVHMGCGDTGGATRLHHPASQKSAQALCWAARAGGRPGQGGGQLAPWCREPWGHTLRPS